MEEGKRIDDVAGLINLVSKRYHDKKMRGEDMKGFWLKVTEDVVKENPQVGISVTDFRVAYNESRRNRKKEEEQKQTFFPTVIKKVEKTKKPTAKEVTQLKKKLWRGQTSIPFGLSPA